MPKYLKKEFNPAAHGLPRYRAMELLYDAADWKSKAHLLHDREGEDIVKSMERLERYNIDVAPERQRELNRRLRQGDIVAFGQGVDGWMVIDLKTLEKVDREGMPEIADIHFADLIGLPERSALLSYAPRHLLTPGRDAERDEWLAGAIKSGRLIKVVDNQSDILYRLPSPRRTQVKGWPTGPRQSASRWKPEGTLSGVAAEVVKDLKHAEHPSMRKAIEFAMKRGVPREQARSQLPRVLAPLLDRAGIQFMGRGRPSTRKAEPG